MKKEQSTTLYICLGFISIISALICLGTPILADLYPFEKDAKEELSQQTTKLKEKHYVNAYCKGQVEYKLPDRTRVDCLTDEYAIEFDYGNKWAESIGQSLYYAKKTGKKPAVALILKKPADKRYVKRIKEVDKDIKVFEIRAVNYKDK